MSKFKRLPYLLQNWSARHYVVRHPVFTVRLILKRLVHTTTRQFLGESLTCPLTGAKIFNIQTLVIYWDMIVRKELGTAWYSGLREIARPVVLDVGANVGMFGHLILSINPTARLIAFEPQLGLAKLNAHAEDLYLVALGDKRGKVEFNYHIKDGWNGEASGMSGKPTRKAMVPQSTLDSFLPKIGCERIDLIKIDVDGYERKVLAGAVETLKRTDIILLERTDYMMQLPSGFRWTKVSVNNWVGVRL